MLVPPRSALPTQRRAWLVAALAVSAALGGLRSLPAGPGPAAAAPAQATPAALLPNLQTNGVKGARSGFGPAGPSGIDGFGYSAVELLNLGQQSADIEVELKSFDVREVVRRRVAARGVGLVSLGAESALTIGNHAAFIRAGQPLGVVARTVWENSGAAVAYAAPDVGTDLVLPLAARDVLSLTTNLYVQDAGTLEGDEENKVKLELFDNDSGELLKSIEVFLEPGGVTAYDLAFDIARFGDLPDNAADGYLGAVRFRADAPIAVLAENDEMTGTGASAYGARAAGRAAAVQYLPVVRANMLGDSLIGIHNRENTAVDVTLTLRGAADSPSGANQTYAQSFRVGPRGAAFVDLGPRRRGTVAAPAAPRGSGVNRGFYGSATVEAGGRVLAAVIESASDGTAVRTSAAYAAYGPDDLGLGFVVPRVRAAADGKTVVAVHNPGASDASVSTTYDAGGQASAGPAIAVPAGTMRLVTLDARAAGKTATLASDAPVAVVAYDTRIASAADWGQWGVDTNVYWPPRSTAPDAAPTTPASPTATRTPAATGSPTATATPSVSPVAATATPTTPSATPPTATPERPAIYLPAGLKGAPLGR